MKFLILIILIPGLTALSFNKDTVKAEDSSTIGAIKQRAQQLYRSVDQNKDGYVSLEELTSGIKRGLGFGETDDQRTSPSYTQRLYQKYVRGDKKQNKYFTQEDFQQIFSRRPRETDQHNESSYYQLLKEKANNIYSKFDADQDGHVSLSQLSQGLKSGLGFHDDDEQGQNEQKDEKSLTDYANELYQKYVKSDKKDNKSFSKEDFQDIFSQRRKQSLVQKAKNKASQIYKQLDSDKDDHISLDQLTKGMKSTLGFSDQEQTQQALTEKAKRLYQKYVKSDKKDNKGFTLQDVTDIVSNKMRQARRSVSRTAQNAQQRVKQVASDVEDSAEQLKNKASDKASQVKKKVSKKASQIKDDLSETAEQVKDAVSEKADQVKDSVSSAASKARKAAQETLQDAKQAAADAASRVKDNIADKVDDVKQAATNAAKGASKKLQDAKQAASGAASKVKDKVGEKVQDVKQAAANAAKGASKKLQNAKQAASDAASKAAQTIGDAASTVKDTVSDAIQSGTQKLKEKASEIYSKFDKDGDDNISFEEFKSALKSSLNFDSDGEDDSQDDEQEQKSFLGRAKQLYQTYVKPGSKDTKFTKEDFFQTFSSERKLRKGNKNSGKFSLEQLKNRASSIHSSFDANKDGHVSLEQIKNGLKQKIGFGDDEQSDQNSLYSYAKTVFDTFTSKAKKGDLKLTKDDFIKIIYEWKDKAFGKKQKKSKPTDEQL